MMSVRDVSGVTFRRVWIEHASVKPAGVRLIPVESRPLARTLLDVRPMAKTLLRCPNCKGTTFEGSFVGGMKLLTCCECQTDFTIDQLELEQQNGKARAGDEA